MTKQNYAAIAIVLDESSSMGRVASDTVGGLNQFITEQKNLQGEVSFTLNKFSDSVRSLFDFVNINTIPTLEYQKHYYPNGNTALYDAINETIDSIGRKLSQMNEWDRPSKVIVAILTDGEENMSRTATAKTIAEKIRHQEEVYNWEFVFLGANQDAILSAQRIGIAKGSSMTYAGSSAGTKSAIDTLGKSVTRSRSFGSKAAFTDQDVTEYNNSLAAPVQKSLSAPTPTPASVQVQVNVQGSLPHWANQPRDNKGRYSK